jgi:transketolase
MAASALRGRIKIFEFVPAGQYDALPIRVNMLMNPQPPPTPGISDAKALQAKLRLLKMHYEAGVGHIGGNLSALDIMLCLHHDVMSPQDKFVLSKGHAAGALYVTLWSTGQLAEEDLSQFHRDGTRLSGHPPAQSLSQVQFGTGSLGHGIGIAAGMALGLRLANRDGRVFCLTSDGEWNEGSSWEALIFAHQNKLSNLTLIVDQNGLQGFGSTRDVADLHPLAGKFRQFNVDTVEVDGHNYPILRQALRAQGDRPRAIVANTRKGCGISFMENRMEWHYLPLTQAQYQQAVEEITQCERLSVNRS